MATSTSNHDRVVERIACEMRGHGTGINRQRQIYDELLSEFYELRRGQEARFPIEDQIPQDEVNVAPEEAQLIVYDGAIYRGQIPITFSWRERDSWDSGSLLSSFFPFDFCTKSATGAFARRLTAHTTRFQLLRNAQKALTWHHSYNKPLVFRTLFYCLAVLFMDYIDTFPE